LAVKSFPSVLIALIVAALAPLCAAEQPAIPTIDISGETDRRVIISQGTETNWQGHPHTVLLPDGKTMFCVWAGRQDGTGRHGAPGGLLKRSDDGGLTWSGLLDVPANWKDVGRGSPTIHRLVDTQDVARLFVYCRDEKRTTFLHAVSTDEGLTWSPLRPLDRRHPSDPPITGWTAPMSILEARGPDGRRRHLMWYERTRDGRPAPGVIWQSTSEDGGRTDTRGETLYNGIVLPAAWPPQAYSRELIHCERPDCGDETMPRPCGHPAEPNPTYLLRNPS